MQKKSAKKAHAKQPRFFKALERSLKHRLALSLPAAAKPGKLRLAVTRQCNSRCLMCNIWQQNGQGHADGGELSLEEYDQLFSTNRVYLSRLNHLSLTGGEPTLRPDLLELVELIGRHHPGIALNLNTNAFNQEPLMDFVKQAVNLTRRLTVMVSLDGMGDSHDQVRGVRGAFERTMRSLEALLEFRQAGGKIRLAINHVFTPCNYQDYDAVFQYCHDNNLGLTSIVMQQGKSFANEGLDLSLGDPAAKHLIEVFERRIAENGRTMELKDIEVLEQLRGMRRDYRCWAGKALLLIDEQGGVYPNAGCPEDWRFGNVRQHDYNLVKLLRTKHAAQVFKQVKECRKCRLACEILTTLRGPEALAGYGKLRRYAKANNHRA